MLFLRHDTHKLKSCIIWLYDFQFCGLYCQVHIENITKGREYERFMLDSSPVLRDNAFDESQEMVTLMTEQKVSCILKTFSPI